MENCKICGKELKKKGRTVHYGCRCAEKLLKNGGNTSVNRHISAFKGIVKNPDILRKLF